MSLTMGRDRLFSPQEIEDRIAQGQIIILHENRVLRLDGWLSKHPGGKLAIRHMVGRDATDEINVYHSQQSLARMDHFRIGRIEGAWVNMCPPIRGGVYRRLPEEDSSSSEDSLGSHISSLSSRTSMEDLSQAEDELPSKELFDTRAGMRQRLDQSKVPSEYTTEDAEAYTARIVEEEIERDLARFPSLDAATQRNITLKYQQLQERVKNEGFYDCPYSEYAKEFVRYSTLFVLFIVALRAEWYLASAAFLGLFWHQIMFTAHDAGHMAITHNFTIDTLIGMFVADFCCGLSIGWWKSSHNVHHLVTNSPTDDPDIQNVPLFATSPSFFKSIHSTYYNFTYVWDKAADLAVRYQANTYYPVMAIARFNLYILSWLHLLSPRSTGLGAASWTKSVELLFMTCYWLLFGYFLLWRTIPTWTLRVAFVLISHIITMVLHVQITLSHFSMSTADLGDAESFPQHQLRTTMDVDCPAWLDWFHGGLQFQACHHLFPRVPRHNLRRLQVLVRGFCADVGIEYKILNFMDGNKEVLGRLGQVAAQVEMLIHCQKVMAETGESGLH